MEDPTWRAVVPHFHRLLEAELAAYGQPYAGEVSCMFKNTPPVAGED